MQRLWKYLNLKKKLKKTCSEQPLDLDRLTTATQPRHRRYQRNSRALVSFVDTPNVIQRILVSELASWPFLCCQRSRSWRSSSVASVGRGHVRRRPSWSPCRCSARFRWCCYLLMVDMMSLNIGKLYLLVTYIILLHISHNSTLFWKTPSNLLPHLLICENRFLSPGISRASNCSSWMCIEELGLRVAYEGGSSFILALSLSVLEREMAVIDRTSCPGWAHSMAKRFLSRSLW